MVFDGFAMRAPLLIALVCGLTAAWFALRWAVRNIPTESRPRRLVQAFTIAGGLICLVPALFIGMVGGGDVGGAFFAIPFQFWLGLPGSLAGSIGFALFMSAIVAVLTLLGAAAGGSVGHFLGSGIRFVCARIGTGTS